MKKEKEKRKCNDLHMSIKDFVPDERPEEERQRASIADVGESCIRDSSAEERHENCEAHMRLKLSLAIVWNVVPRSMQRPVPFPFPSAVRIGCV